GASRTPDEVVADQIAARHAVSPTPPSHVDIAPTLTAPPIATSAAAGVAPPPNVAAGSSTSRSTPAATSVPGHASPPPAPPSTATSVPAQPSARVVTGQSVFTEFGYVTVAITVANGRITDVQAVELPGDEPRSISLSAHAGPILRQRALTAQ